MNLCTFVWVPIDGISYRSGHTNTQYKIAASFDEDGNHVICGSEDASVYIWKTENDYIPSINPEIFGLSHDKNDSYEYFKVQSMPITAAVFCPRKTISVTAADEKEADAVRQIIIAAGECVWLSRIVSVCMCVSVSVIWCWYAYSCRCI